MPTRTIVQGVALETCRLPTANPRGRAPILFLHEGLGSVAMWRGHDNWPQQLCDATGRAGLLVSRQGYGASDSVADPRGADRLPVDYLHQQAWAVLPALLQKLGVARPVLLGHSDGGSIALLHAARFPVAACIAMAPHVVVEDITISAIAAARQAYLHGDLRTRLARFHTDVDAAFWRWNDVWLSDDFAAFLDLRADCAHITAPVLAMQGDSDPYGTLRQIEDIATALAGIGRCSLLKLARCGHSPQRDQPDATRAAIVEFLADVD